MAKLVFTSSVAGTMSKIASNGIDETHPFPKTGLSDYQKAGLVEEHLVLKTNGQQGLLTCASRPSCLIG